MLILLNFQLGSFRILGSRTPHQSHSPSDLGQLRIVGHYSGPSVGAVEYRELWRQQNFRHSLGTSGGRHSSDDADRQPPCQKSLLEDVDI